MEREKEAEVRKMLESSFCLDMTKQNENHQEEKFIDHSVPFSFPVSQKEYLTD
jgi:hypothetical protein